MEQKKPKVNRTILFRDNFVNIQQKGKEDPCVYLPKNQGPKRRSGHDTRTGSNTIGNNKRTIQPVGKRSIRDTGAPSDLPGEVLPCKPGLLDRVDKQ